MKLYYLPKQPFLSHAFRRLWEGLNLTKPDGVTWVYNQDEADLVVAPVVNYSDQHLIPDNAVVWQFCYLTADPNANWPSLWDRVDLVVSYLDLPTTYLQLPLGYDKNLWYPDPDKTKDYDCIVTGYVDGPGAEVIHLLPQVFDKVVHVGPNLKLGANYTNVEQISDEALRDLYQRSRYVAGMRYIEGFELPILEGAACGAIPITFNLPCYARWFNDLALLVSPTTTYDSLWAIKTYNLGQPKFPVQYEWSTVMKGFWDGIKNRR